MTALPMISEKKSDRRQRGWGKIKNEQERGRAREGDGNRGKEGDGVVMQAGRQIWLVHSAGLKRALLCSPCWLGRRGRLSNPHTVLPRHEVM